MVSQAEQWAKSINGQINSVRFSTAGKARVAAASAEASDWKDESTDPCRLRDSRILVFRFADDSELFLEEVSTLTYPYLGSMKPRGLHTIRVKGYSVTGVLG